MKISPLKTPLLISYNSSILRVVLNKKPLCDLLINLRLN
jgi:hypothetical protein